MNAPGPDELTAQCDAFKAEVEGRLQASEVVTTAKVDAMDAQATIHEQRFAQLARQLERIETNVNARFNRIEDRSDHVDRQQDRVDDKTTTLMLQQMTIILGAFVAIVTAMTFILNYATPLALLRPAPAPAIAAAAAASAPDPKPAKEGAQKIVR